MPRHLISDAHEWINEIPSVPTYASPPVGRAHGWIAGYPLSPLTGKEDYLARIVRQ